LHAATIYSHVGLSFCLVTFAPATLPSQSPDNSRAATRSPLHAQVDMMKLSSRLRLQTATGRQEGRLSFRSADSLGVRGAEGGEMHLPMLAVDSMWVRGHRTGLGLLIGTVVGGAAYLVATSAIDDRGSETPELDQLFGGGLWVGSMLVGATVGALSSHWRRVHPK
jgi:hypothetical protein